MANVSGDESMSTEGTWRDDLVETMSTTWIREGRKRDRPTGQLGVEGYILQRYDDVD